jgi:cyanate permease
VWGSVAGPVLAGAIYDRTQTYEPMLWMLVGSFSLASLFYSAIIKPWEKTRAQMTPIIDNDV